MKKISRLIVLVLVAFIGGAAVNNTVNHGKYFEISKNIEIFTNLYKEINTYYVDELDPAKLMRTGVDAMLESLDPYTNYISESEIEGFKYITEGKYNGIGAQIKKIGDYVTITEPYEDQPAHKAGMKAGDQIVAIDGKSTKGKTPDDVSNILKGYPGTEIELTVKRPGEAKDVKLTMVRGEVRVPNVPYHGLVSNDIGYVALTTFTRQAGKNVEDAVKEMKEENPEMKGIIFDLRGNGGGLLAEAVNVSNIFIPKGVTVVTTKGKVKDWDRSFKTLNQPAEEELPVVVLIDKNSASASEIVSGVLQDLDRAVLLGQRSYGKGLVQNTRDVGYNSKVKLTTAKYYIPSGRCIQGVEYENGEPVNIPDDKRAKFKTQNGRLVLDGGGVKPDVIIEKESERKAVKSLVDNYMIFDYVTEFALKKESIGEIEDFKFTDWDGFLAFLKKKNYSYESESEKLLSKLMKEADKENYKSVIDTDLSSIEQKIDDSKKTELSKYKNTIIDLIEKEIVSRYYFQKGKIQIGLRNDTEIKEAIGLIKDKSKYDSILK